MVEFFKNYFNFLKNLFSYQIDIDIICLDFYVIQIFVERIFRELMRIVDLGFVNILFLFFYFQLSRIIIFNFINNNFLILFYVGMKLFNIRVYIEVKSEIYYYQNKILSGIFRFKGQYGFFVGIIFEWVGYVFWKDFDFFFKFFFFVQFQILLYSFY